MERKITLSNENCRLSKEDIARMIADAEEFKKQDDLLRERIEAKNNLEIFSYSMLDQLNDAKLRLKFTAEEKQTIKALSQELLLWLEENPRADSIAIRAQ